MGSVPPSHHSKSKVGRRRAHLALKAKKIGSHPVTGVPFLPHREIAGAPFQSHKQRKASRKSAA